MASTSTVLDSGIKGLIIATPFHSGALRCVSKQTSQPPSRPGIPTVGYSALTNQAKLPQPDRASTTWPSSLLVLAFVAKPALMAEPATATIVRLHGRIAYD